MPKLLLRGVIDFGDGRATQEQLTVNFRHLLASNYDFKHPDERKLWTFIKGYVQVNGEVPAAALIKDHFDRIQGEETVVYKLLDVKVENTLVRTHYVSHLRTEIKGQKEGLYKTLYQELLEITNKGMAITVGGRREIRVVAGRVDSVRVGGREVRYHGTADAERYRQERMAEIETLYAEPVDDTPAPIVTELNPPGPFPLAVFPSRIQKYLEAVADNIGVPQDYVNFAALGVLGLASQRKLKVRMTRHRVEPCVLWMMLIAPSGAKKSPVYHELMRPVHAWTKREHETREKRVTELKDSIKIEHRATAVKGADKSHLQELQDELEKLPPRKRVTIQDITPSSLIKEFAAQQGVKSLCVADDDRNRFADFAGGRFQAVNEMSILHNAYDGSQIEFDRRGSNGVDPSAYIPEARFGSFLMTHPSSWDDILDPRNTYKDGLIGRLTVYVHPPMDRVTREGLRRPRIPLDPELQDEWDRLITSMLTDPVAAEPEFGDVTLGEDKPEEIEFSVEGQEWWVWVNERAQLAVNSDDPLNPYLTWTSKWAAKMGRMYGVLAYARQLQGEEPPAEDPMHELTQCVVRHAVHALGPVAAAQSPRTELQEADALAKTLVQSAQETGRWVVTVRELTRTHRTIPAAKVRKILETLDAAGHVRLVELDRRKVEVHIMRPKPQLAVVAAAAE